ncbi:rapid alkalinization factor-like [Oryza brachyantha]|uniref:Rapid ALkalinization Factor family protein n=1 Tax=Oryza brachyantha TaxID=4533 RepID=J3N1S7_ORYBR|nr:rapid alkalinization factor-like [Oryza brachyantha]
MARRRVMLPLLVVALLTIAVAAASASAYARAAAVADGGVEVGTTMATMMRRALADLNATADAGNATAAANATTGYISYDALFADRVPCSLRGASYYNCHPGAEANPYTRGCSAITQCRS